MLDRLAKQTCAVMEVEQSSLLVRDPERSGTAIAVAACGPEEGLVGSRLDASRGLTGQVLAWETPVVSTRGSPAGDASKLARAAAPVSWRSEVRGALTVHTHARGRRFGAREIEVLSSLADTAGAAIAHAERRHELLASVPSHVWALAAAVTARDIETADHCEAVAKLSCGLGESLGLAEPDLLELECAALLHDLGKIGVPEDTLAKRGPLNEEEMALVRHHTVWGADLIEGVAGLEPVATIVRFHHERWDGSGYPTGLEGEQIPIASRIIAVCDAYHAMTSDRSYRRALGADDAARELRAAAGTQFDPALVKRFVETVEEPQRPRAGTRKEGRDELLLR